MRVATKPIEMDGMLDASSVPSRLRILGFISACALPFVLAWSLMRLLASLLGNDTFSQVPLIPIVSVFLIYNNREAIFSEVGWGWGAGGFLITPGMISLELARVNLGCIRLVLWNSGV
jgi:hypothetical protein